MQMIGKEILNYRITSCIGQGGMGSVYLAEHKFIKNDRVAIKVINADMVNDYTRERLDEEARLLSLLKNNNIVDFRNYDIDDNNNIYLLMEYVEGKDLNEYIHHDVGLIVEERICDLFCPILDAIGYAHKNEIIHRDIKPSNIIITPDGVPKILDFGIATSIKKGQEERGNYIVGTPAYMSPEQVKGDSLDVRSDIYSLGVLLFEMLTGREPYNHSLSEIEINQKILEEPLPRLKEYYKYTSKSIQKIVDKATAKNPEDRYQSCEEFKQALISAKPKPKLKKSLFVIIGILAIAGGTGLYYIVKNHAGDIIPQMPESEDVEKEIVTDSVSPTEVNPTEEITSERAEEDSIQPVIHKPKEDSIRPVVSPSMVRTVKPEIKRKEIVSTEPFNKSPVVRTTDSVKQTIKRKENVNTEPFNTRIDSRTDNGWQNMLKKWNPKKLPPGVTYDRYAVSGNTITITYKINKTLYDFDSPSELNAIISRIEEVTYQAKQELNIPANYEVNTIVLDSNKKKITKKQ